MFTQAAQGISYDCDGDASARGRRTCSRAIRTSGTTSPASAPAAPPAAQLRDALRPSEAALGAQAQRRPTDQSNGAARELGSRVDGVPAESAADPDRRAIHTSMYQMTLQSPDTESLYKYAPMLEARMRALQRSARRQQRLADAESAGDDQDRSRQGARTRRHRQCDRERARRRLRLAPDLDHLRAQQRVLGNHGGAARVPDGSRHARVALRALVDRLAGAAEHGGKVLALARRAAGQSLRAACHRPRSRSTSRPESRSARRSARCKALAATRLPDTITANFQAPRRLFRIRSATSGCC